MFLRENHLSVNPVVSSSLTSGQLSVDAQIQSFSDRENNCKCVLHNGSTVKVVACQESGRGKIINIIILHKTKSLKEEIMMNKKEWSQDELVFMKENGFKMRCKTCKGKGYVEKELKGGPNQGTVRVKETCDFCNGSGEIKERKRGGKEKGFDWSV